MDRLKLSAGRASTSPHVIIEVKAREVIDSRGNPTVEAELRSASGRSGRAIVPSGASTGAHEALELRDGGSRYNGMGVLKAVSNIDKVIAPEIEGLEPSDQKKVDQAMIRLDGTGNKKKLGANAILAVSMATARLASRCRDVPLLKHLNPKSRYRLPVPMMNIINGGKHAGNRLAVQEVLIEPVGAKSFVDAVRMGSEVYHTLKGILKEKYGPTAVNVGDEGGYAPPMRKLAEALDCVISAIQRAGYSSSDIMLGFDAAASEFYDAKRRAYSLEGRTMIAEELEDWYASLTERYPIRTIEDPFDQDSFEDFARLTSRVGRSVRVIGDDLYVTNTARIKKGLALKATNSVLIKPNQIGTVSETVDAIELCKRSRLGFVISHRSGESEDTFIAHLAAAFESEFIKAGAPSRAERTAKYNELIRIEESLGRSVSYAGLNM